MMTTRKMVGVAGALCLLLPATALAVAQEQRQAGVASRAALEREIEASPGVVRFEFDARPDAWGDGKRWHMGEVRPRDHHGCAKCTNGPVRVTLRVDAGRLYDLDGQVGGDWKTPGRDVGPVAARVAMDYLLSLVEGGALDTDSGEEALGAAVAADADLPWQRLLRIGDDRTRDPDIRSTAIFWVAREAGLRAAEAIEDIAVRSDEDTEVQEAAIFALTQLPEDRSTDVLLRIARENRNPALIQTVYFWLGQSEDPRVLRHFEEVLTSN